MGTELGAIPPPRHLFTPSPDPDIPQTSSAFPSTTCLSAYHISTCCSHLTYCMRASCFADADCKIRKSWPSASIFTYGIAMWGGMYLRTTSSVTAGTVTGLFADVQHCRSQGEISASWTPVLSNFAHLGSSGGALPLLVVSSNGRVGGLLPAPLLAASSPSLLTSPPSPPLLASPSPLSLRKTLRKRNHCNRREKSWRPLILVHFVATDTSHVDQTTGIVWSRKIVSCVNCEEVVDHAVIAYFTSTELQYGFGATLKVTFFTSSDSAANHQ